MAKVEVTMPKMGESITEGTVIEWHKQPGEQVSRDELIVDIETDKVVLEIVAPDDGVVESIIKQEGDIILSAEVIGTFSAGAKGTSASDAAPAESSDSASQEANSAADVIMSPAAKKMVDENN